MWGFWYSTSLTTLAIVHLFDNNHSPSGKWHLIMVLIKRLSTMWETWVRSLGREVPWRKKWQSTPILLPGKSHGQRSLVGYIQSMGSQRVGHDRAIFTITIMIMNVNNIENISMWLLAICKSSLEKCLFRFFVHFQMGYLFIIGLWKFFIYSTYKSLIRRIVWKYFRLKTVSSFW